MELSVLTSRHLQAGLLAPPNPLPQGASTASQPGPADAAPKKEKALEGAARVEPWQEIALEQLANLDPYPFLHLAAAEIMYVHE